MADHLPKNGVRVPWAVLIAVLGVMVGGGGKTAIDRIFVVETHFAPAPVLRAEFDDVKNRLDRAEARTIAHDALFAAVAEQVKSLEKSITRLDAASARLESRSDIEQRRTR